ncbi:MAG: MFS transporter, partial [Chloroflexota bacterium]
TMARSRSILPARIVLLFAVAHLAHHLVTALPVPLLPFIRDDFGLDYTRAGLVVSALMIPYGLSQPPAGWLADRFGARRLLLVGISGVALTGVMVGLSVGYTMLLVSLAVMGVIGGGYHPAAPSAISQVTEPSRTGSALGVHMMGGSASYFLAPLAAGALAAAWGWRMPFVALAVPALIFGVAFFALLGRRGATPSTRPAQVSQSPDAPQEPVAEAGVDWPRMVTFLVLTNTATAAVLSVLAFIPLYLVDVYGYADHRAAMAVALFYSTGLWAAVLGGSLSDRIGRVYVVVGFALLAGLILIILDFVGSAWMVLGLLLLLGVGHYCRAPASESYVLRHTPAGKRSSVLGLYYFGSMESSGLLAPAVGSLLDRFGFGATFTSIGAAMLLITVICTALLLRGSSGARD